MISAKFVPLKYYTLSSQLRRLTSFSVGLFGLANSVTRSYPVMRKSCIGFHICCQGALYCFKGQANLGHTQCVIQYTEIWLWAPNHCNFSWGEQCRGDSLHLRADPINLKEKKPITCTLKHYFFSILLSLLFTGSDAGSRSRHLSGISALLLSP